MKNTLFIFLFLLPVILQAQESTFDDSNILWRKEAYGGLVFNTSGWGINSRLGTHMTGRNKRFWDFDIVGIHNAKEYRIRNYYDDSKSYIFGKLNKFYVIRAGLGIQHIITHKPFWGGVELRLIGSMGVSLGITKPIYLYIIHYQPSTQLSYNTLERYDPVNHSIHDIYGRGPYTKGFGTLTGHPGLFLKLGLNFEYGTLDQQVNALEAGIILDSYTHKIPIMAYEHNSAHFMSLYISFNIGARYNTL